MKSKFFWSLLLVLVLLLSGVLPAGAVLKVGILPDADSIPLIVAREEGLFAESGYDIQVVRFHNPIERDSALQAGAIDGAISDVLAAAFALDQQQQVKITSFTNGRYVLVGAPGTDIDDYQDLEGKKIAISRNTIIEYVTDRLLKKNGYSSDDVAKVAIPKIPVRLQMLQAGKIKAACLPEPLASVVKLKGAAEIGNSTELGEAPGIILFTQEAVTDRTDEIKAFYQAYSQAVDLINQDPDSYRDLLVTKGGFPAEIKDTFAFPVYDQPKLPASDTIVKVLDWLESKGLLDNRLKVADLVTDQFVK